MKTLSFSSNNIFMKMNEQCVKEDILQQSTTPVMEMDHIVIKEEHHDNFFVEHQGWDEVQVKQEPGTEIPNDDNSVQLPQEMPHFSLTGLMPAHHVVIKEDFDDSQSEVLHNTSSPDSEMQISLNVKPSSVNQYSEDNVKESMCNKRQISTILVTGNQMRKTETNKGNEPLSQSEKTLTCDTVKLYTCDNCNKCFSTLYRLKRHLKTHTVNKPHTCETCLKCFNTPFDLKRHIRIHTGSKPYTCDICNKCFRHLSTLKSHTRIHTGIKPYTCDTCHKCFSQLCNFKTHIRIHTGSRPYACETCQQCFTARSDLKKHVRVHTGSKPYSCDTCNKCFSDLSNLRTHTRIHTG